jgi:hypothetical protein
MTTIGEIENAVRNLSRDELAVFREWFDQYEAAAWDRQFEADVRDGRLDDLAKEALQDLRAGRCTDL